MKKYIEIKIITLLLSRKLGNDIITKQISSVNAIKTFVEICLHSFSSKSIIKLLKIPFSNMLKESLAILHTIKSSKPWMMKMRCSNTKSFSIFKEKMLVLSLVSRLFSYFETILRKWGKLVENSVYLSMDFSLGMLRVRL